MQLEEALRQISDIRRQMARSEVFRGYRSMTVAFSGIVGLAAAAAQPYWIASPEVQLRRYLALWLAIAGVCLGVAGLEVGWRAWRAGRAGLGLIREHTLLAAEQFLPCVVVGGLLTLCVYHGAPQVGWMLPGLWALIFGLGIFASGRLLPRQSYWVGSYYVLCGCACLLWGRGEHALAPWQMGLTFGGGQLLGAAVLYWTLERSHGSSPTE